MLKVKQLTKKYRNKCGIFNVNLDVYPSEVIGIIGDNGSGKSTLLKSCALINPCDTGSILYNEQPLTLKDIGFLPENKAIIEDLTAFDYIQLIARMKNIDDHVWEKTCETHCDWLQAKRLLPMKIKTLSKGNKQKIQILAACIHEPCVVLLDEPFSGLDEQNRKCVKNYIMQLKSMDKIVIITSHKIEDIEDVSDSLCWIEQGVLSAKSSVQTLKEESSIIEVSVSHDFYQQHKDEKGVINIKQEGNVSVYSFDQTILAHQFMRLMLKTRNSKTISIRNNVNRI